MTIYSKEPLTLKNIYIKNCYIQLYDNGKPKSLKHKTSITMSYVHAQLFTGTMM